MSYEEETSSKYVKVECWRIKETEAAVLIEDIKTREEIWLPLSQVESMHFKNNGEGYLMLADWIAKKKGLY